MSIKDDKLQQLIGWFPHNKQIDILTCDNKEVIVCAGRRFGKSAVCGYIIVRELLNALQQIKLGKRTSCKIWIVAPTYELTNKVFEYVIKFLLAFDKDFGKYVSGGTGRPGIMKMSESVWIQCKSTTEPMSLLGEELDLCILDEAALIPEKIYFQYIYPLTIAKSRNTKTYLISTPRGKNWFQKLFIRLKGENASFQFTSLDGVETDPNALEKIKQTTPDMLFRQEYLAEFLDEAGTVFKDLDQIIAGRTEDAINGHHYVMGVDLGQMDDYTAISIFDIDTHQLVHQDRFRGIEYPLQKEHIIAKARRFNNARVIIDATGVGKPIYQDLGQSGIFVEDFIFSGKSKEELIGNLIVFTKEKYITIPNIDYLIDELKAFEYQYINETTGERLRNPKYSAPKGQHDDCVMSLALACWGLQMEKPQQRDPLKELLRAQRPKKIRSFI